MALVACGECGHQVSDSAPACPHCGAPQAAARPQPKPKIDRRGAWCPHCGNRDSTKDVSGAGCLVAGILLITVVGILLIPFLPKTWKCHQCGHQWRA
jgi:RNA polymerase subunit RPABC4/transcription elongation factor Spt4